MGMRAMAASSKSLTVNSKPDRGEATADRGDKIAALTENPATQRKSPPDCSGGLDLVDPGNAYEE
jgi:hypothetical protein